MTEQDAQLDAAIQEEQNSLLQIAQLSRRGLSKSFLSFVSEKTQDDISVEELEAALQQIAVMAPSLCAKDQSKELQNFADILKEKPILDEVKNFLLYFWSAHVFEGLSTLGSRALISFVRTLFSGKKVVFSEELAKTLVNISASAPSEVDSVFNFLKSLKSYSDEQLYNILEQKEGVERNLMLAKLAKSDLREKCLKTIFDSFNSTYLNDSKPVPLAMFDSFKPYFNTLTEEEFVAQVLPELEFTLNRSNKLMEQVFQVLANLEAYDFSKADLLGQIEERIVKQELLFKPEFGTCVRKYFALVEKKLSKEDQAKQVEKLWNIYKDSKQSNYSLEERAQIFSLLAVFKNHPEHFEAICTPLLEEIFRLYGQKEASILLQKVPDLKTILKSGTDKVEEVLKTHTQAKASTQAHVQLINFLSGLDSRNSEAAVEGLIGRLKSENLKVASQTPYILEISAFFCLSFKQTQEIEKYLQPWFSVTRDYFCNSDSHINSKGYFMSDPSENDVQNHLLCLEVLIQASLQNKIDLGGVQKQKTVLKTLLEYLINVNLKVFRSKAVFKTLDTIFQNHSEELTLTVLSLAQEMLLQLPQETPLLKEEEALISPNHNIQAKIRTLLKLLLQYRKQQLSAEEFSLVISIFCSNRVMNRKFLYRDLKVLESCVHSEEDTLETYFDANFEILVQNSLYAQSGILSRVKEQRETAINILACLAHYGKFSELSQLLKKIIDPRSFETFGKLSKLMQSKFDYISHFSLMFYAQVSNDLLKESENMAVQGVKKQQESEVAEQKPVEEEKKAEEPASANPVDAQALMKAALAKKMAEANKSKAQKGKKGKADAKKPAAKKAAPAAKPKAQEPKKEEEVVDKATRNKMDREAMKRYFTETALRKLQQVEAVQQVLVLACQSPNCDLHENMDLVFQHLIKELIQLLKHPQPRFSTLLCLKQIFDSCSKSNPLHSLQPSLMRAVEVLCTGSSTNESQHAFFVIFQQIQKEASFGDLEHGFLSFFLEMANCVLKDQNVTQSTKELTLQVVESILDTNPKVQNIQLIRVAINMMKNNFISPALGIFLRKLMKRLSGNELGAMTQHLFEFEPTPRKRYLDELYAYEKPLFCPTWFSTQIWILHFDENYKQIARKIWNKYGLYLQDSLKLREEKSERNIFMYLRSKNTAVIDATVKATVSAAELYKDQMDSIVEDLIGFYQSEWDIISKESAIGLEEGQEHSTAMSIMAAQRQNRVAIAHIVQAIPHLLSKNALRNLFKFLVSQGCQDQIEAVKEQYMEAAKTIIRVQGKKSSEDANDILEILEAFLKDKQKIDELGKNQAVILVSHLANFLEAQHAKKLQSTFEKMLELLFHPNETIRKSICLCIPRIVPHFKEKSQEFLEDNQRLLVASQNPEELRGAAYAIAGLYKGLGLGLLVNENQFLKSVNAECGRSKANPERKLGALYLYETLAFTQGKAFELIMIEILENVLKCISDHKEAVREAALAANKVVLQGLSNLGIKRVLPTFLKGLEKDNWRQKLASVEALGSMAFCAPKQIAGFLPQIVKGIREMLNDTHEKVHEAALQAIQNIGSVIKCPEISDILEHLVRALSNTNEHLNEALKVLLETQFVHAIDAPSLSLIVPILDAGLQMHDNESKKLASQLMGNICELTQDAQDLLPYLGILMPAVKISLFDSIPEIRASAAKAIGSLSRGLGLEASKSQIVDWLFGVLHQENLASSERSGAAQGYAEIIAKHGAEYFDQQLAMIFEKARDKSMSIREAFRDILVFLPTCYKPFVNYLPKVLPLIIEGLSDDNDEVRKVSLRNVKICIKQFGKMAPVQLVKPIQKMMFDKDFKVRQQSSVLMYQLIKELENDVIKLQPKYITVEMKQNIISSLFILRHDTVERVSTSASQIWKNIIENQPKTLKSVINVLIDLAINIIQSPHSELQEMGLGCMRGLAEKFGEKIVNEAIDVLESYLEKAEEDAQTVGICKAFLNMAGASSDKLIHEIKMRFVQIIDQLIAHPNDKVRALTCEIALTYFYRIGESSSVNQVLEKSFCQKLTQFVVSKDTVSAGRLIQSFGILLRDANLELSVPNRLINMSLGPLEQNRVLTVSNIKVLFQVAPFAAPKCYRKQFHRNILEYLLRAVFSDEATQEQKVEATRCLAEFYAQMPNADVVALNEDIVSFYNRCQEGDCLILYLELIAYYCSHTKNSFEYDSQIYLRNILLLANDKDSKVLAKVIESLNSVCNGLPKEAQFQLVTLIREMIEHLAFDTVDPERDLYINSCGTLKLFEQAEGVKSLVVVFQNSIMHGSTPIRIDAAVCFKYLVELSKPDAMKKELIKICGALIRVVNDKFPPELKLEIFKALQIMMNKFGVLIKAMLPQLQTTFLKAFNDPQANISVRNTIVENLLKLVKLTPKSDPIVKELAASLDGEKVERESKTQVSEVLAFICRDRGEKVAKNVAQGVLQTLGDLIENNLFADNLNDRTKANVAAAYAFFGAHHMPKEEWEQLFDKFQEDSVITDTSIKVAMQLSVKLEGKSDQVCDHLRGLLSNEFFREIAEKGPSGESEESAVNNLPTSLHIVSHLGNNFLRKFADEGFYNNYCALVAETFRRLREDTSKQEMFTYQQINQCLAELPIVERLNTEAQRALIGFGLDYLQEHFLNFDSKKPARIPVHNLMMLNYNNFTEVKELRRHDKQAVRKWIDEHQQFAELSKDQLLYANEMAFI